MALKKALKDSEIENKEHVSLCFGDMSIRLYLRVYTLLKVYLNLDSC
jgi:hypothetical protein